MSASTTSTKTKKKDKTKKDKKKKEPKAPVSIVSGIRPTRCSTKIGVPDPDIPEGQIRMFMHLRPDGRFQNGVGIRCKNTFYVDVDVSEISLETLMQPDFEEMAASAAKSWPLERSSKGYKSAVTQAAFESYILGQQEK